MNCIKHGSYPNESTCAICLGLEVACILNAENNLRVKLEKAEADNAALVQALKDAISFISDGDNGPPPFYIDVVERMRNASECSNSGHALLAELTKLRAVVEAARKNIGAFDNDFGASIVGAALPELKFALAALDKKDEK